MQCYTIVLFSRYNLLNTFCKTVFQIMPCYFVSSDIILSINAISERTTELSEKIVECVIILMLVLMAVAETV